MKVDTKDESSGHSCLLGAEGLTARQGNQIVLEDFSLKVDAGEIVTLIGPTGAGKTTAVRTLLGLLPIDQGKIFRAEGLKTGYVPQSLSIERAMPMPVKQFLRFWPGVDGDAAMQIMAEMGLTHLSRRQIHDLSGGEWRRVLLARAMALGPNLLVLDEPLSGVDVAGQAELYQMLGHWRQEKGLGILIVSHDLHLVMAHTDHVICLNRTIQCAGAPRDIRENPSFQALFGSHANSFAVYAHHPAHQCGQECVGKGQGDVETLQS